MQVSTLNRVISLFLIGGLAIIFVAALFREQLSLHLLEPPFASAWGPAAGVFLAVGLVSLTALAGVVVDALGNLTVRRFIRLGPCRELVLAELFFGAQEFKDRDYWREAFKKAAKEKSKYNSLSQEEEGIDSLAAAIFLRAAEKEHAEWFVQHHSLYYLSADFVVILLSAFVYACYHSSLVPAVGFSAGAYLLTTFAVDKYFYSYQLALRQACLVLRDDAEPTQAPAGDGSAPNKAARADC